MTKQEAAKLIAVAMSAYPDKVWNEAQQEGLVNAWCMILEDYTYQQGSAGLKIYLKSDKYNKFPGAGQIASIIDDLQEQSDPQEMTATQAWAIVRPAIKDSTYHSRERFAEFPDIVKAVVGDPDRLKEWASLSSEEVDSVVRSNFCNRDFPTLINRRKEEARLPKSIRAEIEKKRAELAEKQAADKIETADSEPLMLDDSERDTSDHSEQIENLERSLAQDDPYTLPWDS